MTQVNIDNTPVTEAIADGSSITVPHGETWRVTISCQAAGAGSSDRASKTTNRYVEINGTVVAGARADADASGDEASASATSTVPFKATLIAGTTVGANGGGVFLSGYKV